MKDISVNHADTMQKGETIDKSGLRGKLRLAFKHLEKLNIKGVLQGDLMFTDGDLQQKAYEGETYTTFQPNEIIYAVPTNSEIGQRINRAKVGIVFHTSYEGDSLENMTASFRIDLSDLTPTADVWFDDAYIKDYSGMATMTAQESAAVNSAIANIEKELGNVGNAFEFLDGSEAGNDLKINIAAKLRESSPEGKVLSAPTMSLLTGTRGVIRVEQERSEGKKQGFRMAVQPSVSANGILLEGYAVYGTYDPNEIDKQTEIFGLFSKKAKLPSEDKPVSYTHLTLPTKA